MINLDRMPPHLVDGSDVASGGDESPLTASHNPFTGECVWQAPAASRALVSDAIAAARRALAGWARLSLDERLTVMQRFVELVQASSKEIANLVVLEAGKAPWDARTEANALVTKLTASVEAYRARSTENQREVRGMLSRTRMRPHGVMAVLGPFNFPLSMANGHIMPALLAGNTVVFKPSELTSCCGLLMARYWREAGLPPGVLNCVTGGRYVGEELVRSDDIDGILFVGSHATGMSILRENVDRPEKIVALELGGNSPIVVWDYDSLDAACLIALQSTFVSAGQRCSAARRLIMNVSDKRFIPRLVEMLRHLRIGDPSADPEPYYGPLIRPQAAVRIQSQVRNLIDSGAKQLLSGSSSGPWETVVSPTVLDVSDCETLDEEIFGPVLKVEYADTIEEAIIRSNDSRFGLAAGIVCRSRDDYEAYFHGVRAGIVNWNQQLTGATTFAPFGGVKQSGNYRPAGFLSADYCSYSIASFEVESPSVPSSLPPGVTLDR